jgi:hypothetical protein
VGARSLANYTWTKDRFYEEKHVEEWVAREPLAIFPPHLFPNPVLVLAAEKYRKMPRPLDLLFVDATGQFPVVELKINPVAESGSRVESREDIRKQMEEYVEFLRWYLDPFPASDMERFYSLFSERFHGERRELADDLRGTFGEGHPRVNGNPPNICRVYLTAGYDACAINYFGSRLALGEQPVRLVYFLFYPDGHRIEFWEVPLTAPSSFMENVADEAP